MVTQVPFKEDVAIHQLPIYVFLQKFYDGQLNNIPSSTWTHLIKLISEDVHFFANEKMNKGIEYLLNFDQIHYMDLEFDFNRLFVGPNRLEASPYESTYRNKERAVMQNETLAVRRFYETAGLVLQKKNKYPDDHLALELEFICYLLENSLENGDNYILYQEFLKKHMFQWVEDHCELVREKTLNDLIIGTSYLLQGLMEFERKQMNIRRRLKK